MNATEVLGGYQLKLYQPNPVYIDLQIGYDKIICDSYEITGIKKSDEFKNAIINYDLSKVGETKFHTLEINHSDRNK